MNRREALQTIGGAAAALALPVLAGAEPAVCGCDVFLDGSDCDSIDVQIAVPECIDGRAVEAVSLCWVDGEIQRPHGYSRSNGLLTYYFRLPRVMKPFAVPAIKIDLAPISPSPRVIGPRLLCDLEGRRFPDGTAILGGKIVEPLG